MRNILAFLALTTAGCTAAVVGPTGAALTDPQLEALVTPVIVRDSATRCRWVHPSADSAAHGADRHEVACATPALAPDSARWTVTYATGDRGRGGLSLADHFVGKRCLLKRRGREDLGVLHCWNEWVY